MAYSPYFTSKHPNIPAPVTLIVVCIMLFFLAKIFNVTPQSSRATKKYLKQLQLVNPSQNQMGIYWQTDKKEIGWVLFGEKETELKNIALDDRDTPNNKIPYLHHYVLLTNLKPRIKYFYKIVTDNVLISDSNGNAYQFQTMDTRTSGITMKPAYGKVVTINDRPLENAVVMISFSRAYPLISLTKTTGEWLLPLNSVFEQETGKERPVINKEKALIEIMSEDGMKSNISTDVVSMSPVAQTTIIGKDYQLINQPDNVLSAITENEPVASEKTIDILFPKEGVPIPGKSPLIKGSSLPNSEVIVTIHSPKTYSFRTSADKDGSWTVLMPEELSPGEHTITMVTKDRDGKEITINRKFIIAKSGEQVLGSATQEATPTTSVLPTSLLSPTQIVSTTSPTGVLTKPAPRSGANITPLGLTSGSLIIMGLGLLLAF